MPTKTKPTQPRQIYFDTLAEVIAAIQARLDEDKVMLFTPNVNTVFAPNDDPWQEQIFKRSPINYGCGLALNFEIHTLDERRSSKWFHVSINRLDSGRYELNTYIL